MWLANMALRMERAFLLLNFVRLLKASQGGFHVMISEWRSEVHF